MITVDFVQKGKQYSAQYSKIKLTNIFLMLIIFLDAA